MNKPKPLPRPVVFEELSRFRYSLSTAPVRPYPAAIVRVSIATMRLIYGAVYDDKN